MKLRERYLHSFIEKDLTDKMVFLGGPRQVGKTTLAVESLGSLCPSAYYNWDKTQQRREALQGQWPTNSELIILDEFHKYSKWKTWIKGEFDTHKKKLKFLLTGSARLDLYRRGGDSLQGRYHYYRLHPFSLAELYSLIPQVQPMEELCFSDIKRTSDLQTLLCFGGFPEPFLQQDETRLRRWQNERIERFLKQDVRDLTRINDLGSLQILAELLPERSSSILSLNSLAEDLQVNFRTAAHWIQTFENFYYCFRLSPWQSRKISAVRKEKKLYLWDWSLVPKMGFKLENLVASHLLKFCHFLHDTAGWKVELSYLRDSTGKEVDFLVSHQNKSWFAVEVKHQDDTLHPALLYFKEKLSIPYCYQVVGDTQKDLFQSGIRILPVEKFLGALV